MQIRYGDIAVRIEDTDKEYVLLKSSFAEGKFSFYKLLKDRDYKFDTGLDPTAKNHYYNEGILVSSKTDEDPSKHHRFSFIDAVWTEIISSVRGRRLDLPKVKSLKKILWEGTVPYTPISNLEYMVLITTFYLGTNEQYKLDMRSDILFGKLTSKMSNEWIVNLSEVVRMVLRRNIKQFKNSAAVQDFVPVFLAELDKIKEAIGIPPIIQNKVMRRDIENRSTPIPDKIIDKLLLGPNKDKQIRPDIVYEDPEGVKYALELKINKLGQETQLRSQFPVAKNIDEIAEQLKLEVLAFLKYRESQ